MTIQELIASLCWWRPNFSHSSFLELLSLCKTEKDLRVYFSDLNEESYWGKFNKTYPDWIDSACRDLDWLKTQKAKISIIGDPDYPTALLRLESPPLLISYWGSPLWCHQAAMGVVGSRNPSRFSLDWMEREFCKFLEVRPLAIISGGARGVDQKAHALAIRKRAPTVAFVPSGLARIYPAELSEWIPRMIEGGGAVVSGFAPSSIMHKGNFHIRNRWIAALSELVLVVEARRRSGSLLTAKAALEFDIPMATLPYYPGDPAGAGNLDLIFDGAEMVRDHKDLLTLIERLFLDCEGHSPQIRDSESRSL